MKPGDLVRTLDGRLGIVKSYHPQFDGGNGTSYPWYVHMLDRNWRVEYFQSKWLELVSESR